MDVTENGLRAAVKALTDIIGPALPADDPLAREQLRLVVDYLEFTRARLDRLYDRDRFELEHHARMARKLSALLEPAAPASARVRAALAGAIASGDAALQRSGTGTSALKEAGAALAEAVRELVREAAAYDSGLRRRIEAAVVAASAERITFDRAWYLPLGFDPAPLEVPTLASLLDASPGGLRPA